MNQNLEINTRLTKSDLDSNRYKLSYPRVSSNSQIKEPEFTTQLIKIEKQENFKKGAKFGQKAFRDFQN